LSVEQLALFHAAVDQIEVEPVHTILSLLFPTGMRISEITGLRVEDLHHRGTSSYFQFYGKGDKERVVPLNSAAKKILALYIEKRDPTGVLFPGRGNYSITPHAVRKYTRAIAHRYEELPGLSPHVLRATAASMWLASGTDLITIQKLLGHKSLLTTQRYAQPSFDVLQSAVEKVAGKSSPR
jgi:site-specific recombinase XerD